MIAITALLARALLVATPLVDAPVLPERGMSSAHFVYLPVTVLVGIVIGYLIGSRAVRAEIAAERKRTGGGESFD